MLLHKVEEVVGREAPHAEVPFRIAAELGWNDSEIRPKTIGTNGTSTATAKAMLGHQPAALFVYANHPYSREAIRYASAYAYHQRIRWGLVCDPEGISAFNSHWLTNGDIVVLPKFSWGTGGEFGNEVLKNFTRDAFERGTIDEEIGRIITPDQELRPVDDELVFRLDKWRDQALKYSRDIEHLDDDLQVAYAQFFVLRTIEDRSLNPNVPPLSTALVGKGLSIDRQRLYAIFAKAKSEVCGDLFSREVTENIPDEIIAGVIRDLYSLSISHTTSYRYNFDWLTSDVLGSAYEKYLSTILAPAPLPNQLTLFEQPRRGVQRFTVRRAGGIFYTPQFISRMLTKVGLGRIPTPPLLSKAIAKLSKHFRDTDIPRVVDFACGSGSFLVAAIDEMLTSFKTMDPSVDWVNEIVEKQLIVGIDIDEKAVTIARLNIWQRLTEEPNPLPLPSLSQLIFQGDSLREETWEKAPGKFDLVLGNPPFIATKHIPDREYLEANFETAKGRYDFAYLFVEQALRKLKTGGRLALVIPNRLFSNMDAGPVRNLLTEESNIDLVIDFGSERPFPEASAYVGCIVATRREHENNPNDIVRVIRVLKLDAERLSTEIIRGAEAAGEYTSDLVYAYDATHPKGQTPWALTSQREQIKRLRIAEVSTTLAEVAAIRQGIRTGSNEIFIISAEGYDGQQLVQGVNGLGDPCLVERSMVKPVVIGPEIERFKIANPTSFLIYPYKSGIPLSEAELEREAPNTYKYLSRYRTVLSARRSTQGVKGWYELVRQRDETWLTSPKLITRDLVPRSEFGLDILGQSLLVGGTAIIPSDPELLLVLCGYLNSSLVEDWLRMSGLHPVPKTPS